MLLESQRGLSRGEEVFNAFRLISFVFCSFRRHFVFSVRLKPREAEGPNAVHRRCSCCHRGDNIPSVAFYLSVWEGHIWAFLTASGLLNRRERTCSEEVWASYEMPLVMLVVWWHSRHVYICSFGRCFYPKPLTSGGQDVITRTYCRRSG